MQRIIDVQKLFNRLISDEYELLKYINNLQGTESRPIDFAAAATALNVDKRKIYNALRRLVSGGVLIADGENFRINEDIYRK